jgi:photosystem II stability/assembly factor-like uncharacterized protein
MRFCSDLGFFALPLVTCLSLLSSCQYYEGAAREGHTGSSVKVQEASDLPPQTIANWVKRDVPLGQWGDVVAFSKDGSVAIAGQGAVLFSPDNGRSWKTLNDGTAGYRSTVDGGDTYRDVNQPGKRLPRSVSIKNLCTPESAVLTSSGRLYLKAACEHTTELWSIPTRNEADAWNVIFFTYRTDPSDGVYSAGHNLTVIGERVLIDTALPSGSALLTTDDNGATWYPMWRGSAEDAGIISLSFINERIGWMLQGNGRLLKTTDGGRTWDPLSKISSELARKGYSMDFADSQTGFIAGLDGLLLSTIDGGRTWQRQSAGTTLDLYKLAAANAKRVWAVGKTGTVLETSDGGLHWRKVELGIEKDIRFGLTLKGETAWIVSQGFVFHST